jgi:hypothetical protein
MIRRVVVLVALLTLAWTSRARADAELFALIVTNNRSADLDRPDLQYADDDGARYERLFTAAAGTDHVVLLTRFDRASRRVYPALVEGTSPPRRNDVVVAARLLGERIAVARRAGHRTAFYFVYAGHGRVDEGRGELDLEDGRVDGQFIENEILAKIAADERHIILDSCDSFFVLNPRKPGARRWATPKDMALGFGERHPDVGLLLSTNSEAEVYEWSELESGVFSYEVRSGLSGAADVNGDGDVSYDELAGFIARANSAVPREEYRPQVFARGPKGLGSHSLFRWKAARGPRIELGAVERRVWVRSQDGARLLDLHQEAAPVTVVLPGEPGDAVEIFEQRDTRDAGQRPTMRRYEPIVHGATTELAALEPQPVTTNTRGDGVFRHLFAAAYGPSSFRAYLQERAAEEPDVYGITRQDEARIRHYLVELSDIERTHRLTNGYAAIVVGAGLGAVGAALAFQSGASTDERLGGAVVGGAGLVTIGLGIDQLLSRTDGEDAYVDFNRGIEQHRRNPAGVIAETELRLEGAAERALNRRMRNAWLLGALGGVFGVLTTVPLLFPSQSNPPPPAWWYAAGYGITAVNVVAAVGIASTPSTPERILNLYRQDPDLKLRFNLAPTVGGAVVGLTGAF